MPKKKGERNWIWADIIPGKSTTRRWKELTVVKEVLAANWLPVIHIGKDYSRLLKFIQWMYQHLRIWTCLTKPRADNVHAIR